MKRVISNQWAVISGMLALIGMVAGCALMGSNPSAPSKLEQALFTTVTNYVQVTNQVPIGVPVYLTNQVTQVVTQTVAAAEAPVANSQSPIANSQTLQTPPAPIVVTQTVQEVTERWQTQMVAVVSNVPAYTETVSARTAAGAQVVGSAVNMFVPGVGGLVTSGVLGLLSLWGYFRSSKLGDTSSALAQEIETIRTFVRGLPNGTAYDQAFVNFMQAHQGEANVTQEVLRLLQNEVSNSDAQVAAKEVATTIQQLQLSVTPAATVTGTTATTAKA